jgi:predicted DNA-binding protein YlxM (UPF0122 family)
MADDSKLLEFERYNQLFDWYKPLFTDKQQTLFEAYYHFNLTGQEIAEQYGITKAAVSDTLMTMKQKLDQLEGDLMLVKKMHAMQTLLATVDATLKDALMALWQPGDKKR